MEGLILLTDDKELSRGSAVGLSKGTEMALVTMAINIDAFCDGASCH
jgi:hypothetical protein